MVLQVYGLPFGITKRFQARVGDPLRAKVNGASGPCLPKWRAAKRSVARAVTCCGFIGPVHEEKDLMVHISTAEVCQHLAWLHCFRPRRSSRLHLVVNRW